MRRLHYFQQPSPRTASSPARSRRRRWAQRADMSPLEQAAMPLGLAARHDISTTCAAGTPFSSAGLGAGHIDKHSPDEARSDVGVERRAEIYTTEEVASPPDDKIPRPAAAARACARMADTPARGMLTADGPRSPRASFAGARFSAAAAFARREWPPRSPAFSPSRVSAAGRLRE